jgi:hypothetical protein
LKICARCEKLSAQKVRQQMNTHGGSAMDNKGSRLWYVLLLVPIIAMLWVSSYNKTDPEWAGIPFFYWYQLLWIWIGSALTLLVYLMTRRHHD